MNNLIVATEKHVTSLLRHDLPHTFVYHNLGHTQRVVKHTKELIEGEQIQEEDAQLLIIAAWFHDIGYTKSIENHEEKGVEMAREFLQSQEADNTLIEKVSRLIMATKMKHDPTTLLEKIICDADCAHFKSKSYFEISELLRNEWESNCDKHFNDIEWTQENISFFTQNHRFHTSFALENWQKGKDKNLASLFKQLKKHKQEDKKSKKKDAEHKLKLNKSKLPERGIETMFRVTLKNHITLSNIADTKANILLSVNAIIVSLVLSNLVSKLDNPSNEYLIVPTIIFVAFTVASIILSILATRPNVTSGKFTKEDVANKKVNLLFFGNFHKMKLDEFEWAMGEMMQDRDYLYSSMKKDLYFLGKVLDKKYKILRLTYTVFMVGIIVSVTAFAISFTKQPVPLKPKVSTEKTTALKAIDVDVKNNSYYYF
ncbi:Pycsar system effector family protein [Pontimicrobium sp. IMCC45349]|uniref:Pycsar system effector family protein n=1 Tax=Pontimicrobium sp. IMCC45349 TaxID=3391574 RepID=UPI0039A028DE